MIPYVREIQFEYGACDQVSPLIRRVVANNPGPFTYLGTGTYIIGKGEVAVIDPGPDMPEHLDALMAALEGETVTHILVTHHHSDHSPLAGPLQEKTGAKIYGCAVGAKAGDSTVITEAGHDLSFTPDIDICGGGAVFEGRWKGRSRYWLQPAVWRSSAFIRWKTAWSNSLFASRKRGRKCRVACR